MAMAVHRLVAAVVAAEVGAAAVHSGAMEIAAWPWWLAAVEVAIAVHAAAVVAMEMDAVAAAAVAVAAAALASVAAAVE
jgi:hypothetical protein